MRFYDFDREYTPTVVYEKVDDCWPVWYRVCPKCGRFVKADGATQIPKYLQDRPNATCKRCGRVQMPFCTWITEEDDE